MAHTEVDRNHCYECGGNDVAHASLYPLEAIVVGAASGDAALHPGENRSDGAKGSIVLTENGQVHPESQRLPGTKTSWDYNVCTPCYLEQRKQRYPGDDFRLGAMKLQMMEKVRRLKDEYLKAARIEAAKKLLQEEGILNV